MQNIMVVGGAGEKWLLSNKNHKLRCWEKRKGGKGKNCNSAKILEFRSKRI